LAKPTFSVAGIDLNRFWGVFSITHHNMDMLLILLFFGTRGVRSDSVTLGRNNQGFFSRLYWRCNALTCVPFVLWLIPICNPPHCLMTLQHWHFRAEDSHPCEDVNVRMSYVVSSTPPSYLPGRHQGTLERQYAISNVSPNSIVMLPEFTYQSISRIFRVRVGVTDLDDHLWHLLSSIPITSTPIDAGID
jgi:hypothetical protein